MSQLFGHTWVSQYGDTPEESPLWIDELETLTEVQLRSGIKTMKEFGQDFPPSLPAFMSYCRKGKQLNGQPNFDQGKYIPPNYNKPCLPGKTMTAMEARARVKQMLGIKTEPTDGR